MATYNIKDPTTGKTVSLTGDSPPSEQELEQVFSEINKAAAPAEKGMFNQELKKGTTPPEKAFNQDVKGPGLEDVSVGDAMMVQGVAGLSKLGVKLAAKGAGAVAKAATSEAPNVVEKFGSRGVLDSIGISPKTLGKITGDANPTEAGVALSKRLLDEKAVGNTLSETFSKMKDVKKNFGKSVGSALKAIKETNKGLGVYPELEDALKVHSNKVLKPLIDNANALQDSGYPLERMASRYQRAAYNSLSKAANANDGFLTLDHVRSEMQKVGKMFSKVAPNTDNYHIVSDLYSTLADTRDSMVKTIAEQSGNPTLAENLLKSNAGFSLYTRLLPDVRAAALSEATGSTGIFRAPLKAAGKTLEGPISQAAVKVGGLPRKIAQKVVGK